MESEIRNVRQLADEYTAAMNESARFGYFVRNQQLQLQQVDLLTALKDRIKGFKYGAIQKGNENDANALFHLQCGLNAQISFLRMWIQLKESDYSAAWDSLMDSQEYVSIAMRASDEGVGIEDFLDHLKRVEVVIFPGYAVYNSWGAIISGGECTICHKILNDCEHIEGLVSWGRLCVRVNCDIVKLDHVAMVKEPLDRRCTITEFTTDDGYYRNYMTWRKIEKAEEKEEGTLGTIKGRFFTKKLLEVD